MRFRVYVFWDTSSPKCITVPRRHIRHMDKAMRRSSENLGGKNLWRAIQMPERTNRTLSLPSLVVPDVFGVFPIAGNIHCISKRRPLRPPIAESRNPSPAEKVCELYQSTSAVERESFQVNQLFSLRSHFNWVIELNRVVLQEVGFTQPLWERKFSPLR